MPAAQGCRSNRCAGVFCSFFLSSSGDQAGSSWSISLMANDRRRWPHLWDLPTTLHLVLFLVVFPCDEGTDSLHSRFGGKKASAPVAASSPSQRMKGKCRHKTELDRCARREYQDDYMEDEAAKRFLQWECEARKQRPWKQMPPRPTMSMLMQSRASFHLFSIPVESRAEN